MILLTFASLVVAILNLKTEPLPAKAGRFDLLLKQPEVVRALLYAFVL